MFDAEPLTCSAAEQQLLLKLAHDSIRAAIAARPMPGLARADLSTTLNARAATFVTLLRDHRLRGCVGGLKASDPLHQSVARNAVGAALRDHRFPPLTAEELSPLSVHISILSSLIPIHADSIEARLGAITPGADGIVIRHAGRVGTFLPSVWETLPDKAAFLTALSKKAGLAEDAWSDLEVEMLRYRVSGFGDTTD